MIHKDRTVYADNTVRVNGLVLQIEKSPYRISFARCKVDIYERLDGAYSVVWKKRVLGRYNAEGQLIYQNKGPAPQSSRGDHLIRYRIGRIRKGRIKCPSHIR
jgi:hypothetical protein